MNKISALSYLARGFSIIPVGKDKIPLIKWTKWQEYRADEPQINQWCTDFPYANIGIVTGAASGIVVIDVEAGGNIDDLPKTATSKTGGGGWHLYYRYDPKKPIKNHGRIRELTDIRGDGGYVVAPPSMHQSGKQYSWLTPINNTTLNDFPYWLLDARSDTSSQCAQRSQTATSSVPQGARNETATKQAGKILNKLNQSDWEALGWPGLQEWNTSTCKPPLDKGELRSVWDSIVNRESRKESTQQVAQKEKQTVQEIYCLRPRDGRIIEAYYDPDKQETGLLVFESGTAVKATQIIGDNQVYSAPLPTNNLIKPGFVKLPSEALAYDSESSLLQEIKDFIHEYVQIPADFEDLSAFYVLFSWVYDHFQELPYLRAIGDYGSGKSRFLKVMGALCYRPIFLNGAASASSMFRMIHEIKGTIILDEGDLRLSDTSNEVVKILNSGFQKGIPVFRSEATGKNMKSYDPTPFDVFGPKVIATRKDFLDDALESRCLSNAMETMTREDIPENLEEDFESKALQIRNKLVMFRFQKLSGGISKECLPKLDIEPRLRQIITPIYRVITDTAGKAILLNFIRSKQREIVERRFGSFEGEVLQVLTEVLITNPEPTMKEIAEVYNDKFGGKYPIKPKKVGTILEQTFHLEKRKSAQGVFLCSNQENEDRIIKLKQKFGISEPEMNIVNIVNVPEEVIHTVKEIADFFGGEVIGDEKEAHDPLTPFDKPT